jgi:hypothetical protein
MRNKLKEEDKRVSLTVTLDPVIYIQIKDEPNKSRYIEKLIYRDLLKNNKLNEDSL